MTNGGILNGPRVASHVTRHTSHVTRHMSHVTRHTLRVKRHTDFRASFLKKQSALEACMHVLADTCHTPHEWRAMGVRGVGDGDDGDAKV